MAEAKLGCCWWYKYKDSPNLLLLIVFLFVGAIILGSFSFDGVIMVEGYPLEDLISRLPGQPKIEFRQFGGYVTLNQKTGKSLFYYFVEATENPQKKPLTLWLNGGPGCSSIGGGAFTELGPFYPRDDGRGLRINPWSWNKASNILFVESPAGVGWSYSNSTSDYNCGDASSANDMLQFFIGWYRKFPEYKLRTLFLTGESYAGHYIPQLADIMLAYNRHSSDIKFNLKGLAIGNPLLNLAVDTPATYNFYWSHGLISDETGSTINRHCDFRNYTDANNNLSNECQNATSDAEREVSNYVNNYDVLLDVCYPSIVEQELRLRKQATKISVGVDVCMTYERRFYFNLPQVQQALHANRTKLPYSWSMCSGLLNYSSTDSSINMLPVLENIIRHKVPVWVFSGDQDSVVPLIGSRALIRELASRLGFHTTVPYGPWFNKGQVGGWSIEYGNILTFVTVRGAAHMVPFAQPERAFVLFKSFVSKMRLPNTTIPSINQGTLQ